MSNKPTRKPNVIVFFTDQQRWDTVGLHGNPLNLTPNFDRLASRGTFAANSITCQPVCGPARSCLQTGQYATTTGVVHNGLPLKEDAVTLAKCFNEAGYDTGYIGKWHLAGDGYRDDPVPEEKRGGYKSWLGADVLEMSSRPYDTVLWNTEGEKVKLPGYRVDAMTDAAIRYVDEHQDNPFFLFISYLEPHHQNNADSYPAPDGHTLPYVDKYTPPDLQALGGTSAQHLPGYYGMIKRLDDALGRLQDSLKSLGLEDDTIVMFTSDHGCHFKTRNAEYKRSIHDASVHVPTAFWGGPFNSGGRIEEMVSLVDLPPSLLDGAGLDVPQTMEGRSILPLTRGQREDWPQEAFIQTSEVQIGRSIRTQRWKYGIETKSRDDWNDDCGTAKCYYETHLYNLEVDPYELNNLIESEGHLPVINEMRNRLIKRMKAIGESEPNIIKAKYNQQGQLHPDAGEEML
ncbi:sulfatase-like hydrolase/transferase [Rubellicoccus peritrichatus]|uniref:Sulfatase-like hydrolase/transferase n=1 Tax=Rubellicoccus peritrichatus TaxID=3080537 RepID=A0AAQ3LAE5_9BACT|nr:sulfatase-like hydrolase/transferase [Puniceicoccus sp. CR14]WOO40914.1 sulfatase-like hydrolase/transferase [Puniceicoccus sp. CR14]